jgi:protein-tyrosine phosphatase
MRGNVYGIYLAIYIIVLLNLLVHCAAGISRSSSTVIAYLMKKFGWTYVKAHGFVRGKRPVISPNNGFIR